MLPLFLIVGSFYVPYFYKGYFVQNTLTYLNKRVLGDLRNARNYSAFTIYFYNPISLIFVFYLLPLLLVFKKKITEKKAGEQNNVRMLFSWFILSFITYQFFIANPGTHIHNYLIPLYILAGYSVIYISNLIKSSLVKFFYLGIIGFSLVLLIIKMFYIWNNIIITFK